MRRDIFVVLGDCAIYMNQRDYGFVIKVADLLHDVGVKDTIIFANKYTTRLPNIVTPGIKGEVQIQSVSDDIVLVTLVSRDVDMQHTCMVCKGEYVASYQLREQVSTKFISPAKRTDPSQEIYDDEFVLSMKDETIDIEEFVVQSILIDIPALCVCEECENAVEVDIVDTAQIDAIEKEVRTEGGKVSISFVNNNTT